MNDIVLSLRKAFASNVTKPIEWRVRQLKQLEKLVVENESEICSALKKDLNKHEQETIITEVGMIKNAIVHALNHIDEYVKPKKVTPNFQLRMSYSAYVQYQPLGVVLVIGAWNYPFQLCLVPIVGALASGNCVLIKPSELSEESAKLIEKLIHKYLDQNCVRVVNGGVPETTELLKSRFDYIMYTGNTTIGKIIMEAASKHMTPVTLECGGKSPVFIDSNADLETTAKRIAWGRFSNSGQTCIAPDYVLCTKDVQEKILPHFKNALREYYGQDPKQSDSYARIVNSRHFKRIRSLIDERKVVFGGKTDEKENFIEPTIMFDCNEKDNVMKEEIFGPVLPFVTVDDHNKAIEFINNREKPLALYVFSKDDHMFNEFLEKTTSGSYGFNDVLIQCALECLPFGGVGESGLGAYHGEYSIDTFSHKRAVLKGSFFGESLMAFRYPPYNKSKISQAKLATGLFRRNFLTKIFETPIWALALAVLVAVIYKSNK